MNSAVLPSSPNWYLSSILAYNYDDLLAYGTRNEIVFLRFNEKKGDYEFSLLEYAHTERVTCVVFSPNIGNFKNCIASSGEDGVVRIWDVITHELKLNYSGQKDGLKITGLDWSSADPNLVVFVNDHGNIVCWDLPSNTVRYLNILSKIFPICLACCPHDKNIIAIGAKNGHILVINLKGDGKVVFRVKGHEGDVVSLSWCPVPDNLYNESDDKEKDDKTLLLASGATDRCVYIWKAGVDMRYSSKLCLPNQALGNSFRKKLPLTTDSTSSNFMCVLWVDPYQILSSSNFGELLSWDVRKIISKENSAKNEQKDKKKGASKMVQPRLLHSIHNKGLFSIACRISSDRNIESKTDNRLVWTTALDKHLTACNVGSGQVFLDLPCIGNIVFCLAVSPFDPNLLAVGLGGEGKILVWNMSTSQLFKEVYTHWKKINGKVMALAWHPTEEDTLAFGTADGRVGLITLFSDKMPIIFKMYHRKAIYTLTWAPPLILTGNMSERNPALFSVGDGEVVQFCRETPDRDPISLKSELKAADIAVGMKSSYRSDLAFKHDLSVLAVANENGSVHILSCENLMRLHTLYPHKKTINALVWHPPSVVDDLDSPYKNWLASAAENIKVFNVLEDQVMDIASLTLHSEKVASLNWNPHVNAQLISTSYDCSAMIWDVLTQAPIAVYSKHSNNVLCAVWSPLDPDFAISGSYDNSLHVWRISEQTSAIPTKRKQHIPNLQKKRQLVPSATVLAAGKVEPTEWNRNFSESLPQETNKGLEDYKKRVRARSFFPVTSVCLQDARHLDVLYKQILQSERTDSNGSVTVKELEAIDAESKKNTEYLGYFGDKRAMKNLLMIEDSQLMETGHHFQRQNHALWKGDIGEMLEEATKKKQLSDWLVALSPMCSYTVWVETCVAYVAQLTELGEFIKAASYLLAIHKVEEAILLLMENNLYKEALAIAKSRYPEDDPTITTLLQKWGSFSRNNGQLLLAAHCFLAIGDYIAASEVLVRCNELKWLKFAAVLAEKAGQERADILMKECLQKGILHANYKIVEEIIEEKPEYEAWSLWLEACRIVTSMKTNTKKCEEQQLSWLREECTTVSLLDQMKSTCEKVGAGYRTLAKDLTNFKTPLNDKELWYIVSGHLAVLCASYYDKGKINLTSLQHWVSALATAYQFQITSNLTTPLLQLCFFMSPQGPFSPNSIFMLPCETEEEKSLMKSARAFLCAGIVHWLTNSISVKETIFSKSTDVINGNSETEGLTYVEQLDWLVKLLENYQADVLDPESFCFFKTKTQKQQLIDAAARNKAEKNKVKSNVSRRKLKGRKSIESDCKLEATDGDSGEKDGKEKSGSVTAEEDRFDEDKEFVQESSSDKVISNVSMNGVKSGFNCESVPELSEDSTAVGENELPVVNGTSGVVPSPSEIELTVKGFIKAPENKITNSQKTLGDTDEIKDSSGDHFNQNTNDELEKMDSFLNRFNQSRISAPNPFLACANIKSTILFYIEPISSDLAKHLDKKCDELWKLCGKDGL